MQQLMGKSSRRQEEKIWYAHLDGVQQGPFVATALLELRGFSPDTLVWREGLAGWVFAGKMPELAFLFKDPGEEDDGYGDDDEEEGGFRSPPQGGTAVIKMEPNQFIFWFVIIILIITYLLYRQGV